MYEYDYVDAYLRRVGQSATHEFRELLTVVCEAGAEPSEAEGGTHEHWVAESLRGLERLLQAVHGLTRAHLLPDRLHFLS